jgi:hypothetical protein
MLKQNDLCVNYDDIKLELPENITLEAPKKTRYIQIMHKAFNKLISSGSK